MIIIYLNRDAFAIDREAYLTKVAEANGDWIIVTEWIEAVGFPLGQTPRSQNSCLPLEGPSEG